VVIPGNDGTKARGITRQGEIASEMLEDFIAAFGILKSPPGSAPAMVGVVGFCFGGLIP